MVFILLAFNDFTQWLQDNMLSCPAKKFLHIECPGCGLQRSGVALLKGDLAGSLHLYPATIPLICLVIFTMLHIKYKFSFGATAIKYLYAGTVFVIAVFYIYKIINHKLIA